MTAAVLLSWLLVLQTPASRPATLVDDAARLAAATTNEGRFDALTALLKERGLTFTVEPFTIDKPIGKEPRTQGRNVVVSLGSAGDLVVVGAHYDAARLPDGSLSKGAVDNAASSAILVRVAEELRSQQMSIRLRIVWFDMEELGLIGSANYVKAHAADGIIAMLNFDINAYGNTIVYGPSELQENAALRRLVVQTCASADMQCVGFPQMPPGDDRSFVKGGIPTVSLGIVSALEAHQLWLMLNAGPGGAPPPGSPPAILKTIHTPDDTVDKLNLDTMRRMQRYILNLIRRGISFP
jgi:Zn-dependent M28 family amino/carboxypeptidase